ncbi:MAG: ORF6N domain-containing protein [Tannerella sp.]|jgi:hypothetical protein|nr:ORF6N domain-containing protein [Tannerella sp.]
MELQVIQNKIYEIRGQRVMLDFDLAEMYDVETRRLKEQVKRNIERFPDDFMFQLTKDEWTELIANCDNLPKGVKYSPVTPSVFTQEGVAMLSGVLRSPVAVQVNINIMRAFVAIRNVLAAAKKSDQLPSLIDRIKALEEVSEETLAAINDLSEDNRKEFDDIYLALAELAAKHKQVSKPRNPVGFRKTDD